MRGKGQLLISTLLLFFLNVAAQNEDHRPEFGSTEDENGSGSSWSDDSADSVGSLDKRFSQLVGQQAGDSHAADKRYEFIGKRGPYEFIGKRPFEFVGKRNFYEFLGKRSPYEFIGKRSPAYEFLGKRNYYEFLGKRSQAADDQPMFPVGKRMLVDFYGKRVELPYEFVGKRSSGRHPDHAESSFQDGAPATGTGNLSQFQADNSYERGNAEWMEKSRVRSLGKPRMATNHTDDRISSLLWGLMTKGALRQPTGHGSVQRTLRKRYTEFVGK